MKVLPSTNIVAAQNYLLCELFSGGCISAGWMVGRGSWLCGVVCIRGGGLWPAVWGIALLLLLGVQCRSAPRVFRNWGGRKCAGTFLPLLKRGLIARVTQWYGKPINCTRQIIMAIISCNSIIYWSYKLTNTCTMEMVNCLITLFIYIIFCKNCKRLPL